MAARASGKGKSTAKAASSKPKRTRKSAKSGKAAKSSAKSAEAKEAPTEPEASAATAAEAGGDPATQAEGKPESTVPVLQDWTPLSHCLDYQLGQVAFQTRGAQAFTTNEVPNLINQGGMSAYRAAEVLFANCEEREAAGQLEDEICCLEIAMGLGLASLQMLDRFQQLCTEADKDWYGRLTWYATDATPKMITDARDNGVFERHAERVVLGRVDAMFPGTLQRLDNGEVVDLNGKLRAIYQSYLLSLLPSNLLRMTEQVQADGTRVRRFGIVMARTVLRHPDALPKFTNLTVDQIRERLASGDFGAAMGIAHLYPLFDLDLTLAEVTADRYDGFEEVERIATAILDAEGKKPEKSGESAEAWVLHSSAASVSIRRMLDALADDGFVLFRDYGPASAAAANRSHLYQHYGAATATGLNHFAFDTMYGLPIEKGGCGAQVTVPNDEGDAMIKTRLVARGELPATRKRFVERFNLADFGALTQHITNARKGGQNADESMGHYREALRVERDNWALLTEAAEVALRQFKQVPLASMFARESIRINPWYNPVAWNVLGDSAWYNGDLDASDRFYQNAVRNNPEHWRGWFNLYMLERQRGQHGRALEYASKALANDASGEERERIKAAVEDAARLLAEQQALENQLRRSRAAGSIR